MVSTSNYYNLLADNTSDVEDRDEDYLINKIKRHEDDDYEEETKSDEDKQLIGEGAFGKVYDIGNGLVKKISKISNYENTIGRCIVHPNIISFTDVNYNFDKDTVEFTYKKKDKNLNEITPSLLHLKEIIYATIALNKMGYYHADINPDNILYHEFHVYLADLGGCRPIHNPEKTRVISTHYYAAPEVLIKKTFIKKSQVWSIIMTLFSCWSSTNILPSGATEESYNNKINKIINSPLDILTTKYQVNEKLYKNFIEFGLIYDEKKRPSLEELLLHPLISKIPVRYVEPIILAPKYEINDRPNFISLLKVESIEFVELCMIMHLYHTTNFSIYTICKYVDYLIKDVEVDIEDLGLICKYILLPGNSLYYSMRDENQFNTFMKEYKKNSQVYSKLVSVPTPYRKLGKILIADLIQLN
jgi:serine/threonine protein kinase